MCHSDSFLSFNLRPVIEVVVVLIAAVARTGRDNVALQIKQDDLKLGSGVQFFFLFHVFSFSVKTADCRFVLFLYVYFNNPGAVFQHNFGEFIFVNFVLDFL